MRDEVDGWEFDHGVVGAHGTKGTWDEGEADPVEQQPEKDQSHWWWHDSGGHY